LQVYVSTYRDTDFKVIEFSDTLSKTSLKAMIKVLKKEKALKKKRGPNLQGKDKNTMTL